MKEYRREREREREGVFDTIIFIEFWDIYGINLMTQLGFVPDINFGAA